MKRAILITVKTIIENLRRSKPLESLQPCLEFRWISISPYWSSMFEGLEWIFCPLLERLRASRKVFEDQLQLLCTKWSLEGTRSCSWDGWNSWNILDRILKLVGPKTLKLVGSNLRTQHFININYQWIFPYECWRDFPWCSSDDVCQAGIDSQLVPACQFALQKGGILKLTDVATCWRY